MDFRELDDFFIDDDVHIRLPSDLYPTIPQAPPQENNSLGNNNVSFNNPNPQSYVLHSPILQNPSTQNQHTVFLETGTYPNGQNPGNGLSRQLIQPAPAFSLQYYGLSAENSLNTNSSSRTSSPLQNYETFDLQSDFVRLAIHDYLGLSRANNSTPLRYWSTNRYATTNSNGIPLQQWSDQTRNIEQNYGNSARENVFHHLESSLNRFGFTTTSAAPALSSVYDVRSLPSRVNYSSIEELRGHIVLLAKDEKGCCELQRNLAERNPFDIDMILSEVQENLHELMQHQSANYLIQKLIGVLNEEQMTKFILSLVSSQDRFFRVCNHLTGSRVIQKLLDSKEYPQRQPLTPEQISLLVSALKNITLILSESTHGNHVIKRCLQKIPYEYTKDIVGKIAENCLSIATDRSGCCLLQDCIKYAETEHKGRLIADVVSNAVFLSDHSYGNYVVQFILGLKIPQITADVHAQFAGNYFTLSQGKCSSNVVEKCLLESGGEQSTSIINEIIQHPEILELMLHPFGNYVIQTAWTVSEGLRIRKSLHELVEMNSAALQSQIYGKKVLAKVSGNKNVSHERFSL